MDERKALARQIFLNTLAGIDIPRALAAKLGRRDSLIQAGDSEVDLRKYREIVAIAMGKAAVALAEGITAVLAPEFRIRGILAGPVKAPRELHSWKSFVATPRSERTKFSRRPRDSRIAARLQQRNAHFLFAFRRRFIIG